MPWTFRLEPGEDYEHGPADTLEEAQSFAAVHAASTFFQDDVGFDSAEEIEWVTEGDTVVGKIAKYKARLVLTRVD